MLTWANFRTQIRRSILHDTDKNTWSDEVLLDLCEWAQAAFCAHTAAASSVSYEPAQELTLPDNIYSDPETTALLYYTLNQGSPVKVLPARLLDYRDSRDITYTTWGDSLVLSGDPPAGVAFTFRYFAHYPVPVLDSDLIAIPVWSRYAVAHLIGAFAQTSTGVQSANIDRWKDRRDSGTPEDNALRVQQAHLLKVYEGEIARYPRQDRESLYQKLIV